MAGLLTASGANSGKEIFSAVHLALFCAIWIFVPLVAADCLSKERREGTLGLLFLTPLKPLHITIAKTVTQSLRAFTLWLATLPVIVLPMLMGGVAREEALLSVLINAASFCWALAAGIWVSSCSTQFHRSIIAAAAVAFAFFIIYSLLNFFAGVLAFRAVAVVEFDLLRGVAGMFFIFANLNNVWNSLTNQPQFPAWLATLAGMVGFSLLLLAYFTWRAARVLHRIWQGGAAPGRWARWRERLCTTVVFRNLYRRWWRWSLDFNPIGWLEHRTWSSRMSKWAWLALMCAFYSSVLAHGSLLREEFTQLQVLFAAALTGSAGFTSAASFRRERDNGVLTLLLISPLRVRAIVWGRLRALWWQYLPAVCLLFGAWLYLHRSLGRNNDLFWLGFFAISFFSVPIIGLYCSLWRQTFFGALLWTGLYAWVFPGAIALLLLYPVLAEIPPAARPAALVYVSFGQISIALTTLLLLLRKLTQRSFTLPAT